MGATQAQDEAAGGREAALGPLALDGHQSLAGRRGSLGRRGPGDQVEQAIGAIEGTSDPRATLLDLAIDQGEMRELAPLQTASSLCELLMVGTGLHECSTARRGCGKGGVLGSTGLGLAQLEIQLQEGLDDPGVEVAARQGADLFSRVPR